jgi:hypothetical protein
MTGLVLQAGLGPNLLWDGNCLGVVRYGAFFTPFPSGHAKICLSRVFLSGVVRGSSEKTRVRATQPAVAITCLLITGLGAYPDARHLEDSGQLPIVRIQ